MSLPQEVVNLILEIIAEISKSAQELHYHARLFLNIFESNPSNRISKDFILNRLFLTAIHACNEGTLLPRNFFSINSYDNLIVFLKNSKGSLENFQYPYNGTSLEEKQVLEIAEMGLRLKKVSVLYSVLNDTTLSLLIGNQKLSSLKIMGNKITTLGVNEILRHPLVELEIHLASELTEADIQALKGIESLKQLKITFPNDSYGQRKAEFCFVGSGCIKR